MRRASAWAIFFVMTIAVLPSSVQAASLYWGTSGSNSWASSLWSSTSGGAYSSAWTSGSDAVFQTTASTVGVYANTTVGNLTFNVSETINGANTLTLTATTATLASNVTATIAANLAGDSLTVTGGSSTSRLILSGNNSYTGVTTVAGSSTLRATSSTAFGSSSVVVSAFSSLELTGGVNIGNALAVAGEGIGWSGVINNISGANTLSGPITVNNTTGTARINSTLGQLTITGNIAAGGNTLEVLAAGGSQILISGAISGNVATANTGMIVASNGTVTLAGANAFSGYTVLHNPGGVVQIGNGGTTGALSAGNVNFTGASILAFNRSNAYEFDYAIIETGVAGTVSQIGSGTTTLAGNNTYDATVISNGTLQIGAGGTTGTLGTSSVINNSNLVFNRSNSLTVSNVISGVGSLSQNGSGTTILSGVNTYTGATNVNAGTLSVTGSLKTSGISVASAGTAFSSGYATLLESLASGGSVSSTIIGSDFTTATGATVSSVSAASSISMSWRNRNSSELSKLISDVVNVTDSVAGGSYTLTMTYDVATLTARGFSASDASNIYIVYWDGTAWEALTSVVNTSNDTVSAAVSSSIAASATQFAVVPEPSAMALLSAALLGFVAYTWRKRRM